MSATGVQSNYNIKLGLSYSELTQQERDIYHILFEKINSSNNYNIYTQGIKVFDRSEISQEIKNTLQRGSKCYWGSEGDVPDGAQIGDIFINIDDEYVYSYDGSDWVQRYSLKGNYGSQGIQGILGAQGETGIIGMIGTQGVTGAQGLPGAQGITGAQGQQGQQGPTGIQGFTGAIGLVGAQGVTGAQGMSAYDYYGEMGAQGIPGEGMQGAQGAVGIPGAQGPIGPQGVTGASIPFMQINTYTGQLYLLGYNSKTIDSATNVYTSNLDIYMNGGEVFATSDIRFKNNIKPISSEFIDKLFEQEDITYDFTWSDNQKETSGFIAQYLEEFISNAVDKSDSNKWAVNYNAALSKVIGAIFKKVKEHDVLLKELLNK